MPNGIADVTYLLESFASTFHPTSARVVGLEEAINDAPQIETRGAKKETWLGPGFTMTYRLPFRVGSKAVNYNGAKGVMIEDRELVDDDGRKKVVTLLHYDFVSMDNEEDDNIVDNTKGIEAMFGRPKKRRKLA